MNERKEGEISKGDHVVKRLVYSQSVHYRSILLGPT